ncbi:MAG TPA: type III pantothenate kinase [Chitinophagaceae bacterium]|nr:type III pantothenate kinase [Chitinophagaceae bacterium]
MAVTLCYDFGNTRLKMAVFDNDRLREIKVLPDGSPAAVEETLAAYRPEKSILSSVINHEAGTEALLASRTRFHHLSYQTRLAFTTPVGRPETIGADRLALASAAVHYFPGRHNLVIGLGTCVTYNFISRDHEFLGGAISPGLEMRLRSLNQFTAKLPLVPADSNVPLIGYDTATNIQTGVVMGMAQELDGFIRAYHEKFERLNVLLTGGDIVHLAPHLRCPVVTDPDLLFKGLFAISEANNPG